MFKDLSRFIAFLASCLAMNIAAVQAQEVLITNELSNQIIEAQGANEQTNPNALVNLMTLYTYKVIKQELPETQTVVVVPLPITNKSMGKSNSASSKSKLKAKEVKQKTPEELWNDALYTQSPDALKALINETGLSEAQFIEKMNELAQSLGMSHSHFASYKFISSDQQKSTLDDWMLLVQSIQKRFPSILIAPKSSKAVADVIQKNETLSDFSKLSEIEQFFITVPQNSKEKVSGVFVVNAKTGHLFAQNVILIGNADSLKNLREKLSSSIQKTVYDYETIKLYAENELISEQTVFMGTTKTVGLATDKDIFITIPRKEFIENWNKNLDIVIKHKSPLLAPIEQGELMGDLYVYYSNKLLTSSKLYALNTVTEANSWDRFLDTIKLTFKLK